MICNIGILLDEVPVHEVVNLVTKDRKKLKIYSNISGAHFVLEKSITFKVELFQEDLTLSYITAVFLVFNKGSHTADNILQLIRETFKDKIMKASIKKPEDRIKYIVSKLINADKWTINRRNNGQSASYRDFEIFVSPEEEYYIHQNVQKTFDEWNDIHHINTMLKSYEHREE